MADEISPLPDSPMHRNLEHNACPVARSCCPYLGLRNDRKTRATFPTPQHQCWRAMKPVPVNEDHQLHSCLTKEYLRCPRFITASKSIPEPQQRREISLPSPPLAERLSSLRTRGLVGAALVLLMLLIAGLIRYQVKQQPAALSNMAPPSATVSQPSATAIANTIMVGTPALSPIDLDPSRSTPLLSPTVAPSPSTEVTAAEIRQSVAAAEAGLRTGQLEAIIDYSNGARSEITMRFDLGDAQRDRRIHIFSTYHGVTGEARTQQFAIGERVWQRVGTGTWGLTPTQDGMWEQLVAYLPQIEQANAPVTQVASGTGGIVTLQYFDPHRNADTDLQVDAASGMPRTLYQRSRDSGTQFRVVYRSWNTAVDFEPEPVSRTPVPSSRATDQIGVPVAVNLRSGSRAASAALGILTPGTLLPATGETVSAGSQLWRRFRL